MPRTPRLALLWLAASAILIALPLPAQAVPIHRHIVKTITAGGDPLTAQLVKVVNVAPRDSDKDGLANRDDPCPHAAGPGGCPAPAPVAVSSPAEIAPTLAPTTVAPAPVSGGGCTGMEAESGSLGYANNTNPDYVGCYQISVDHFAAGGSCAGMSTDPSGQDACAATICATEGPGAWTNPAGENPCGRLGG